MFTNYDGVLKVDGEVEGKAYDPRAGERRPRRAWPSAWSRRARTCVLRGRRSRSSASSSGEGRCTRTRETIRPPRSLRRRLSHKAAVWAPGIQISSTGASTPRAPPRPGAVPRESSRVRVDRPSPAVRALIRGLRGRGGSRETRQSRVGSDLALCLQASVRVCMSRSARYAQVSPGGSTLASRAPGL